jgi:hypothetical protein
VVRRSRPEVTEVGNAAAPSSSRPVGRTPLRPVLAAAVGVALAVVLALVVGEYPFTGATPYIAALVVPAVIGFCVAGVGGSHPERWWLGAGVLGAASIAWAVWISTGRGVDPFPACGWAAIALGLAWPVAWGLWLARRRGRRPVAPS